MTQDKICENKIVKLFRFEKKSREEVPISD